MTTYRIGQVFPLDYNRTIHGEPLNEPQWFALTVPANKERAVREHLKARGTHACYPEQETAWRVRGKRFSRMTPVISRVVYAKFLRAPQWDVMKTRRLITGVYSYGDRPIVLPGDVIRHVMGLPTEAEKIEAARQDLLRLRAGDKATVKDGPLKDFTVDVTKVEDGRVWWETITGIKGTTPCDGVERLLHDCA